MKYYAQFDQDFILNEGFFKNKQNGVFIDIGAYDGITGSNTYFFEKHLNWTGLCFEPIPTIFQLLNKNRKCKCVEGCAWTNDCIMKFNEITGYSDQLSGLVDYYSEPHKKRVIGESRDSNSICKIIDVKCFDINKVLQENNIFNIELLSIDTEGSEYEILKHIDYDKFNIQCIVYENNYEETNIREFLTSKDYNFEYRGRIDDFFIKNNI